MNSLSAGRRNGDKKPEELFNSTQMSFGKEIEQMQKQFHDEMQQRITELENLLKGKDDALNDVKTSLEAKV